MDLTKIINKKDEAAQYMIDEITHIIKTFDKRDPGSKGERQACQYMAEVLQKDCGCEQADVEPFKENPGSFYGWIYFTITFVIAGIALSFFAPILSIILIVVGLAIVLAQFGFYLKLIDWAFPEKTGHNVTAIKKCTSGTPKRRILFNGHPDAAWEWPMNYKFGGVGFEGHAILCGVGAIYYLVIAIIKCVKFGVFGNVPASEPIVKASLIGLVFLIPLVGLYWMVNYRRVVDGANDNLSGCYMGIAVMKAGLRGSKAWCEAHKGEFQDCPTMIISYDTIHDPKYLMVNYRDLNGTVKADKDYSDLFMEAAEAVDVPCKKGWVPPLGGITGLNHNLEDYYHTRRDTYDNMNAEGLANCYAATVKACEMFINGAKQ